MKAYIENSVQTMINEYRNNPKRVRSDYNREREAIDVYKGRELLELIQNADDELLDDMSKEIKISFIDGNLTISNNGSSFSEEGIDSLMYTNISAKTHKKNVIGNKGTGFRAILGWADKIKIISGDLSIKFSDSYSQQMLNESLKNLEHKKNQEQYRAATLVFPEWTDQHQDCDYTTEISIRINGDESIREDIYKQLHDIDGELLLFLNRTEELIIETESKKVYFKKTYVDTDRIRIEKYTNESLSEDNEWLLNRREGDYNGKQFTIVIAYNREDFKRRSHVIYSYFPTDIEFPFPVLLHANFNLNSDRNHLTKNNKENQYILEQACKLLIDTAMKLTSDKVSYEPLLILAPRDTISKELNDYRFESILYREIRGSEIFPTVNGQYISFAENPRFYESDLAKYLQGQGFQNLLMHTENGYIRNLVRKLNQGNYYRYSSSDIVKKINKWSRANIPNATTFDKHAAVAIAFLSEYQREINAQLISKMPRLIYDTDEKLVSNETSIFLRDRKSNITNPPLFAHIKFMHPKMRLSFENKIEESGRNLASKLDEFGVKEYNTLRIIEKMNSVIKKQIDNDKLERAKQYCKLQMKWTWDNREILNSVGEKIKIYMITRKDIVKLSNELYIGKEYGNHICENLFNGSYDDKFVEDIRKHISDESMPNQTTIDFLETLGLDHYPKKRLETIKPEKSYIRDLLAGLNFPYAFEGTIFHDLENMISRVHSIKAEVLVIDELDSILKKAATNDIIEWIKADSSMAQLLFTRAESTRSNIKIVWDSKQSFRYLHLNKIFAYTYWKFKSIPWIIVNENRFNIKDCILSKVGYALKPILVEPDIDLYIKDIEGSKTAIRTEYEYILGKIGVESDFAELTTEKIYNTLTLLPEIKGSESIAKRFYLSLIKSERNVSDDDLRSKACKEFMEIGKVLCNTGYQKIKDAWYLDGKSICDKITKKYNLIEIPKRQNSGRIKRMLGVDKLVLKGEVIGEPIYHPENQVFQKDFFLYKPMAYCYRIENATKDEKRRFFELNIILCTKVVARYTDDEIELDDYDFILKDSRTFYLKVPSNLKYLGDMKQSVAFAAAIANVLCSYIDVSETFASFRELYGANHNSRKELIFQIFEDHSILERAYMELNYSYDTKEEYIKIVSKCTGLDPNEVKNDSEDLDFNDLNGINNAPIIIDRFKKFGIDVDDYNKEKPSTIIDLYKYYEMEFTKLKPKYESSYKLHHYDRLKDKSIEEKMKLVDLFMNYEFISPKITNTVHYNCEEVWLRQLGLKDDQNKIDLIALYKRNKSKWEKKLINKEYVDAFLTNTANMSLIYYGEYNTLNRNYKKFCDLQMSDENYIEHEATDVNVTVSRPQTKPVRVTDKQQGSNGKKSTGYSSLKNLEKTGMKGEKIVYRELKKTYSLVKWVSENAKYAGINPEGSAGLGYDMEYVDHTGERKYIEIKSSKTNDLVFHMSEHEYNFAMKHLKHYVIYYVTEVFSKDPKILILDNVFEENGFNEEEYTVDTKKEYRLSANIDEL